MQKVRLHKINHRGNNQIGIDSPYENSLVRRIKTIPNIRWSQTHCCWYVKENKYTVNLIYNSLKEHCFVDYSALKKKNEPATKQSTPSIQLSAENKKKLGLFIDKITLKNYSPHTLKTYQNCFSVFLLYAQYIKTNVSEITKQEIETFMLRWKKKKNPSASYQNQMVNAIKFYYEQVEGKDRTIYNIARAEKPRQLPKVISEEDVAKLLGAITNLKHCCIVSLIYFAGLRMSELLNLKISDIQSDRKLITIKGAKGKKDRISLLSERILLLLRTYFKHFRPKGYLFEGANGKKYSATSVNAIIKRYAKRVNIQQTVSAHVLRHSFATHLLERGTDIRYIQKLLGHGSSKTTDIYTHITKKGFENLKSPLDNLTIETKTIAFSQPKKEDKYHKKI